MKVIVLFGSINCYQGMIYDLLLGTGPWDDLFTVDRRIRKIYESTKVKVLAEAVSPNIVHDKCDETMFGPTYTCELNDDVIEPKVECFEDCANTKFICDCNVYRFAHLN